MDGIGGARGTTRGSPTIPDRPASSDFGVLDFAQDLAVIGKDNVHFKTIILVNNIALDHRATGKLDARIITHLLQGNRSVD